MEFKEEKAWWESKTMWVNGLAILAGLAAWAAGSLEAGLPLTIGGAINVILRAITSSGVTRT